MSVSDHIASTLQESDIFIALKRARGFNDEVAKPLAAGILKEFQSMFGGREIYVPVDDDKAKRNKSIKQEFNGSNHAEICRCYNISLSTLYRIIR